MVAVASLNRLLGTLPAPLHRLALRAGFHAIQFVRRNFGRAVSGCTVVCADRKGSVLLVRHSYMRNGQWMLPGGAINKGEQPVEAARRELFEEVSCQMDAARFYTLERVTWYGCQYDTFMVEGVTDNPPRPDGREVVEAAFFDPAALPETTEELTRERIDDWLSLRNPAAESPLPQVPVAPAGNATAIEILRRPDIADSEYPEGHDPADFLRFRIG